MEYTYEYRDNVCSLVCRFTDETINNYIYYMLNGNKMTNILKPEYEQGEDGYERLVYRLPGMCSLNDYVAYYGSDDRLNRLCEGIKKAWSELDSYMIDSRYCIWDFNYIYVNCETGEPNIVCLATDGYVSSSFSRDEYLCCLGYDRNDIYNNRLSSEEYDYGSDEYDDSYDDDYNATQVLCSSNYNWIYVNKDVQVEKEYDEPAVITKKTYKKEKKRKEKKPEKQKRKNVEKKGNKRRQPKVIKVKKAKNEIPRYIIPGYN